MHDGKIKLEADLLKLYKDNEKLRRDLSKALRLVYKNSLSKNSAIGGDFLAGPTLGQNNKEIIFFLTHTYTDTLYPICLMQGC